MTGNKWNAAGQKVRATERASDARLRAGGKTSVQSGCNQTQQSAIKERTVEGLCRTPRLCVEAVHAFCFWSHIPAVLPSAAGICTSVILYGIILNKYWVMASMSLEDFIYMPVCSPVCSPVCYCRFLFLKLFCKVEKKYLDVIVHRF